MEIRKVRKIGNSIGLTGLPRMFSPGDVVIVKPVNNGLLIQKAKITPDE